MEKDSQLLIGTGLAPQISLFDILRRTNTHTFRGVGPQTHSYLLPRK